MSAFVENLPSAQHEFPEGCHRLRLSSVRQGKHPEERCRPRKRPNLLDQPYRKHNKLFITVFILVLSLAKMNYVESVEYNTVTAACPQPGDDASPCSCSFVKAKRTLTIKCSFKYNQDVQVDSELLKPYMNHSLTSAYIRLENASSMHIMETFLHDWYTFPSAALDVWRGGIVQLDSPPQPSNLEALKIYRTFVGVGLIDSRIPIIPTKFLRDRNRAALRIKNCIVKTFMKGAIHNVGKMRYLVIEDSKVDTVEGPLSSSGILTLDKKTLHSWFGLLLQNITAETIESNAFNLTHSSDMERAVLQNSQVTQVETGAITAAGDIEVIIKENKFAKLQKKAFQVEVTGNVIFNHNVIEEWEPDALEGLVCHEHTMLETNTFHVADRKELQDDNTEVSPFHSSCGKPQVFVIVNPALGYQSDVGSASAAAWVLGILSLLLAGMIGGLVYWVLTNHHPRRHFIIRGTMKQSLLNSPSSHDRPLLNSQLSQDVDNCREEPEEIVISMEPE